MQEFKHRRLVVALFGVLALAAPAAATSSPPMLRPPLSAGAGSGAQVTRGGSHRARHDTCSGSGQYSFIGGSGGPSTPNVAAGTYSGILSGQSNYACGEWSAIGAGYESEIDGIQNFIGGGVGNLVSGSDDALAGGAENQITDGNYAAIAGGASNVTGNSYGFIGGGGNNSAPGYGAAIVGGAFNVASGSDAAIGGGGNNSASGENAVIPGGYENFANGKGAFAAGQGAHANNNGSFVWSDEHATPLVKSTAPNQFIARASGGFVLYTSIDQATGVTLAAGSGSWSSLSDRAAKTAIVSVDDDAVLTKIASLPVSEWSYTAQGTSVRHLGPMAQDFHAAFGLGEDDRHIASVDEDGVALAALKALKRQNDELRSAVQSDDARLTTLERRLERVQASLDRLAHAE